LLGGAAVSRCAWGMIPGPCLPSRLCTQSMSATTQRDRAHKSPTTKLYLTTCAQRKHWDRSSRSCVLNSVLSGEDRHEAANKHRVGVHAPREHSAWQFGTVGRYRTSIASSASEGPKRMAASAVVAVPSVWCRGSGLVLTVYSLFTHDTLLPTQHRTSYKATRSTVVARILEYWKTARTRPLPRHHTLGTATTALAAMRLGPSDAEEAIQVLSRPTVPNCHALCSRGA
jgi:hypothetical protein